MKNIKLIIEYDGNNYFGWQKQNDKITIEGELTRALESVTGEEIKLIGSGRTDAGVHALGQVANFTTNSNIPGEKYKHALLPFLPDDISIRESEEVDLDFHSRFDASKKRYKYIVYNDEFPKAIYRNFSYNVPFKIKIEDMIQSSKQLIGTHDFTSFMVANTEVYTTIKTIYSISIKKERDLIVFTIEGSSFLRNMIRIIIGTLIYIGTGKIPKGQLHQILSDKRRESAGPTAPPQGLYLEKVYYEKKPLDIDNYMY